MARRPRAPAMVWLSALFVLFGIVVGLHVLRLDLTSSSYRWGPGALGEVSRDLGLRLPWALSCAAFVASLLAIAALALQTIWSYSADRRQRLLPAIVAAGVLLVLWPWTPRPPSFLPYLLATLGPDRPEIAALVGAARILFAASPAVLALLAFSFAALARGVPAEEDPGRAGERMARFHTLLYLAAFGLVAGVLCSVLRLRLQIAPGLEGEAATHAHSLASTVSLTYGGSFTLFLLALFAPTSQLLRSHARRLTRAALPGADADARQRWMREHRLDDGRLLWLVRGFAVLAPLLTAIVERGIELAVV